MDRGEHRARRVTLTLLAICAAVGGGIALAGWAMAGTDGFYTDPARRAERTRPDTGVADDFWNRQRAGGRRD